LESIFAALDKDYRRGGSNLPGACFGFDWLSRSAGAVARHGSGGR
jgi:hypothetical protein